VRNYAKSDDGWIHYVKMSVAFPHLSGQHAFLNWQHVPQSSAVTQAWRRVDVWSPLLQVQTGCGALVTMKDGTGACQLAKLNWRKASCCGLCSPSGRQPPAKPPGAIQRLDVVQIKSGVEMARGF